MPIKILQLSVVDTTINDFLTPLIDRLEEEGYEVWSVCARENHTARLSRQGYKIKNIRMKRRMFSPLNLLAVLRIMRFIRDEGFAVVHVHTPIGSVIGRIAAKLAGTPVVIYTAHGFYFHEGIRKVKYRFYVWIERITGRLFTDYIFTQSEEDRITAVKEKIIAERKITTIGNGVDSSLFDSGKIDQQAVKSLREELNLTGEEKIICFIGRLVREKGIIDLLEAFKQISGDYPGARLLVIGDSLSDRDSKTKNEINNLLQSGRLADRVLLTGYRRDIPELLSLSDIFVLPSYREGMPRSIIEAMMLGKPVVATNIRGCREEVVEGQTGFLVEVNNPEMLAARLDRLLADAELRKTLGRNGRKRALEYYDEESVLDKQVEIIDYLLRNTNINEIQ